MSRSTTPSFSIGNIARRSMDCHRQNNVHTLPWPPYSDLSSISMIAYDCDVGRRVLMSSNPSDTPPRTSYDKINCLVSKSNLHHYYTQFTNMMSNSQLRKLTVDCSPYSVFRFVLACMYMPWLMVSKLPELPSRSVPGKH